MAIDARVLDKSDGARAEDRRLMQEANMAGTMLTDFSQDANLQRAPDYMVYVYSIVNREFILRRPPSWPRIIFAPCPEDEDCKLVGAFPSPVHEVAWMEDRTFVTSVKGEYFVADLLDPARMATQTPEALKGELNWAAATCDLTRRGLFMSLNKPPKIEEIQACRRKLEAHYRWLLGNGDELDRANRRREIGPEHHAAAEYFQYRANWHYSQAAPTPCLNCGEVVKPGLAYHMNAAGMVCVLDWKRAVQAGVKKLDEVPANERWEGFEDQGAGSRELGAGRGRGRRPAETGSGGAQGELISEN